MQERIHNAKFFVDVDDSTKTLKKKVRIEDTLDPPNIFNKQIAFLSQKVLPAMCVLCSDPRCPAGTV